MRTPRIDGGGPARDTDGTGVMYLNSKTKIRDVTDGTSHTFLVAECDIRPNDPYRVNVCPDLSCQLGKIWASENRVTTAMSVS